MQTEGDSEALCSQSVKENSKFISLYIIASLRDLLLEKPEALILRIKGPESRYVQLTHLNLDYESATKWVVGCLMETAIL